MTLWLLVIQGAFASDFDAEAHVRFTGVDSQPAVLEEERTLWRGTARSRLHNVTGVEAQLAAIGARPEQAILISAQLAWGTLVTGGPDDAPVHMFARNGLTLQQSRLSDGEVLSHGTVIDEHGTYDLSDPKERARLCARLSSGKTGGIQLHTWAVDALTQAASDADRRSENGFLMVEGDGQRTAMVELLPGESATVVEAVDVKRSKTRRRMDIQRGDRVVELTETEAEATLCLDY